MLGMIRRNSMFPVFPMFEETACRMMNDEMKQKNVSQCMMPLDIYEAESQFVIKADLPGIKKDEIKIQLNKNQLTIEAVTPAAEKKENEKLHHQERYCGRYYRNVYLPENIQGDGIKAKVDNGVLTVVIPKAEQKKSQQINID